MSSLQAMVTVHRAHGVRVVIFVDDHVPARVHVFGDGEAKINITSADGVPELLFADGITRADIQRAMQIVKEQQVVLPERWSELHGLCSRMSRDIVFDDYGPAEMVAIFQAMATGSRFALSAEGLLVPLCQRLCDGRGKDFANARDVRNLFEQVVEAQANRVGVMPAPTKADVCAITADDIRTAAMASNAI